jgi:hypothetical protein
MIWTDYPTFAKSNSATSPPSPPDSPANKSLATILATILDNHLTVTVSLRFWELGVDAGW